MLPTFGLLQTPPPPNESIHGFTMLLPLAVDFIKFLRARRVSAALEVDEIRSSLRFTVEPQKDGRLCVGTLGMVECGTSEFESWDSLSSKHPTKHTSRTQLSLCSVMP